MKSNFAYQLAVTAAMLHLLADAQQTMTVGSSLELVTAASSASEACIATFESHGQLNPGASGVTDYLGGRMTIRYNLLKDSLTSMSVAFHVVSHLNGESERLPELDVPYLLLGTNEKDRLNVQKIVEPTASNVQTVLNILERRGLKVAPIAEAELKPLLEPATKSAPLIPSSTDATKHGAKPTGTVSEHATDEVASNSIRWEVIVVLSVATGGLLWSLLKRRS